MSENEYFRGTDERVLRKVIITAAVTGAVHTPSMSDYLPITPEQIANDAVESCKAGAAIVHVHARVPETGEPTCDLEVFREILSRIKSRCNAIVCLTTGGAGNPDQRIAVVPEFKPEMATLNCGTMNTGALVIRAQQRLPKLKFAWERERIERSGQGIFQNTYRMQQEYAKIARENDTKPELEIWDVGQIRGAWWVCEQGLVEPPLRLQFVMGSFSGMPATVKTLVHVYEESRRMLPDFTWSVAAIGRDQLPIAAVALTMGGDVRVGMEDSLFSGYGRLARSSAEQVKRIVGIARQLSIAPATPDEAREMLGLKGLDKVRF